MVSNMKLKLNTSSLSQGTPSASSPPPNPTQTPTEGKLKLSLGSAVTQNQGGNASTSTQKKPKKSAGSKKRPREDDDPSNPSVPAKKRMSGGTINFAKALQNKNLTSNSNPNSPKTPLSAIPLFKLNTTKKGKPPPRPVGVGYDSEAEDAEDDPSIEENIILRMAPGSDCDYLRDAIAHNKVGVSPQNGGADVFMRFYRSRRAAIVIRGKIYAAVLVDLPCIVESMKSWDKRGWWKCADICQMLLVIGQVATEAEAEHGALPKTIDQKTWQYPHGLTPPMRNVRKNRFRKRVSFKTIEAAEDEVERLMSMDDQVRKEGGTTETQMVDLDRLHSQDLSSAAEEEDADGDYDEAIDGFDGEGYDQEDEDEDSEALAERMAAELAGDGGDAATINGDAADPEHQLAVAQPSVVQDVAPVDATNIESDDEDEDEDEDERDGAEADVGEDQEQAQLKAQQREEVTDLQREIEKTSNDLANASNPIIVNKFKKRLDSLKAELASKKRSLGEDTDDE